MSQKKRKSSRQHTMLVCERCGNPLKRKNQRVCYFCKYERFAKEKLKEDNHSDVSTKRN